MLWLNRIRRSKIAFCPRCIRIISEAILVSGATTQRATKAQARVVVRPERPRVAVMSASRPALLAPLMIPAITAKMNTERALPSRNLMVFMAK